LFKKIFSSLLILCFLLPTISAIEIMQSSIDEDIEQNQYLTRPLTITNTADHTIYVSLKTVLPIFFSTSYLVLNASESRTITLLLFGEESQGYINITDDTNITRINVSIDILEMQENDGNITIFPSPPNSGEMFIIALPDAPDISGFIWINNEMYPIQINGGFTTVELENTAYGEAKLWLYGEGWFHNFSVECGLEGNAVIGSVDDIKIGEFLEVTLKIGDEPLANTEIVVTDPTGVAHPFKTDGNGKIYQLMDKVGEWLLRAEFHEKPTVKKITVTHQTMTVLVNKATLNLGETLVITTGENTADIVIKKDGISQFQTNIQSGTLEYNPPTSGKYTVEVESGNKKGTTSFIVNMQTNIRILDKNNMQTSIIKQGAEYIIQVVDENNQPIPVYQSIKAEKKVQQQAQLPLEPGNIYSNPLVTIPLNNGLGFWQPTIHGTYTLSVENNGNYIGSSIEINIEQKTIVEETDMTLIYILIGIIVAITIIILLFALHKKGIITMPSLPKHKKIPDNLL